tara:strand:+ start:272 stop:691 length:420 start_codon:yes stop_codon:yes gene_type:complete
MANRSEREIEFFYNMSDKREFWHTLARHGTHLGIVSIPFNNVLETRYWMLVSIALVVGDDENNNPLLLVRMTGGMGGARILVDIPADLLWMQLTIRQKRALISEYERLSQRNNQTRRKSRKGKKRSTRRKRYKKKTWKR